VLALEVADGADDDTWGYYGAGWSDASRSERTAAYDEPIAAGSSFRLEMVKNGAVVGAVEGAMPEATEGMSFKQIFQTNTHYDTDVPRGDWYNILGDGVAALQPNCNVQGFNTQQGVSYKYMRLGLAMNQEHDCGSGDTGIGIGFGNDDYTAGSTCSGNYHEDVTVDGIHYTSGSCAWVAAGFKLYVGAP
jgi:hypothetical protein